MTEVYGSLRSEKLAEENTQCRNIVKEITDFGISERQKYLIMFYLSLELEDIEKMKSFSNFIKDQYPEINMTSIYEGNH